jgi:hypothetical protein
MLTASDENWVGHEVVHLGGIPCLDGRILPEKGVKSRKLYSRVPHFWASIEGLNANITLI